ncbi:hypothetical protein ACJ73_00169 [Blastomyces percursus]|uniref:Uncharacterized protein n=1 Tax=Blastomyces percursus TaxID=1658174 RepID=A0A1J9RLD6_9EURO|nr:hypothetical protein ACJ73_00169 [Blastomyces percursus]
MARGIYSRDRSMFIISSSHHAVMSSLPVTAKEYIESESSNQVTVWASSGAMFRDVFLLWMDEAGEKLVKSVEFLDSQRTVKLLELM